MKTNRILLLLVLGVVSALLLTGQTVTTNLPPNAGASSVTTAQGLKITGTSGSTLDIATGGSLGTGTCTVTLSDGSTSGGSTTATWVKSGRLVTVVIPMYSMSTAGFNNTNQLRITGLPFPAAVESIAIMYSPAVSYPLFADISVSGTTATLNKNSNAIDSAAFTLTAAGITAGNNLSVFGTISYLAP